MPRNDGCYFGPFSRSIGMMVVVGEKEEQDADANELMAVEH